jgi:hypothetical protein
MPLINLPPSLKEIVLLNPLIKNIKVPYGCLLYINNKKII